MKAILIKYYGLRFGRKAVKFSPKCRDDDNEDEEEKEEVNCWTFQRSSSSANVKRYLLFNLRDKSREGPAKGRHNDSVQFLTFRNYISRRMK